MSAAFGGLLFGAFLILLILHFIFNPITWFVVFLPLIILAVLIVLDAIFGFALFKFAKKHSGRF